MPKRRKTRTSSPSSPPFRPVMDPTMNAIMDKLNAMSGQMDELLAKSDHHENAIKEIKQDLAAAIAINKEKDEIISKHSDQLNACEQALRSTSIRIIGLPVTTSSSPANILNCVFDLVLQPILDAAMAKGEIDEYPSKRYLVDSAFAIPSKNQLSSPIIVKLTHPFVKNLVFQLKKEVLPTTPDSSTSRVRLKYGIYEDLTAANAAQFRTINEDPRTTAIWTFNGQIKFRVKEKDTIYRVRSLFDTVDSLMKVPKPNQ